MYRPLESLHRYNDVIFDEWLNIITGLREATRASYDLRFDNMVDSQDALLTFPKYFRTNVCTRSMAVALNAPGSGRGRFQFLPSPGTK